jgi:hypothetical protein
MTSASLCSLTAKVSLQQRSPLLLIGGDAQNLAAALRVEEAKAAVMNWTL